MATSDPLKTHLQSEMARAEYEPLLPIEKKLIGWSLGIGLMLLVLLAVLGHFFPVAS